MADLITMPMLTVRLRRTLDADEEAQAAALIEDASALVRDVVDNADVVDLWDAETPGTVPSSVVPVVVNMVRRGLDNPHGFAAERSFEYSYSGASSAGVFATPGEVRILRRAGGRARSGDLALTADLPAVGDDYLPGGAPVNDVEVLVDEVSWLDGAMQ